MSNKEPNLQTVILKWEILKARGVKRDQGGEMGKRINKETTTTTVKKKRPTRSSGKAATVKREL